MTSPSPSIVLDLAMSDKPVPKSTRICLNMIVGDIREPYLAAALESAADVCDWAVVNLNGRENEPGTEANRVDLLASRFNKENRITFLSMSLRNYSFNRNICLEASRNADWILRLDSDEILWKESFDAIKDLLAQAEAGGCNRIISYFWHFLKSWSQVQNSSSLDQTFQIPFLFKMSPDLYWHGVTHERIAGSQYVDLIAPKELWCHFGYVNPIQVFDKWIRFAWLEGTPNEYATYFNDPKVPWRNCPAAILDDREQHDFKGSLPEALIDTWEIDLKEGAGKWRVHLIDCTKNGEGSICTCQHDPSDEDRKKVEVVKKKEIPDTDTKKKSGLELVPEDVSSEQEST